MKKPKRYYFRILVISYAAILIVSLFINYVNYYFSKDIMEEEVMRSNSAILTQARTYVDNELAQVELLSMDIGLNTRINEYMNVYRSISPANHYKIYNIMRDLSVYKNKYPFIKSFFVFFRNSDTIITPTASWKSELYKNYMKIDNEEWENVTKISTKNVFAKQKVSENSNLTFIRPIPIILNNTPSAAIVISIDEEKVRSVLGDLRWLNNGLLYIADSNGDVIITNGSDISIDDISGEWLDNDEGYTVVNTDQGIMAVSYISSNQHGWKYVSVMPLNVFMGKLSNIRTITLVFFLLNLTIGIVIAVLFAYKNYSPVKKVMNLFSGSIDTDPEPGGTRKGKNEFDYIENMMTHIVEEDKRIQLLLDEQKPIIRDNILHGLLYGRLDIPGVSGHNSYESVGIRLPHGLFTVAVLNLDKNHEVITDEELRISRIKIRGHLLTKFADEQIISYVTETENENLSIIININAEDVETALVRINELSGEVIESIKNALGLSYTIGIGSVYSSAEDISKAFMEATRSLEYRILDRYGSVIQYSSVVKSDQVYYFPIELEVRLIRYFKAGDLGNVLKAFNYIYEENVIRRHLSPDILKLLFSNMIGVVARVIIDELKTDYQSVFREDFNPNSYLNDCNTVDEIKDRLITIFTNLCNFINNNKKSHNTGLANNIQTFIKKRYKDQNLCLQMISEEFNITVPYLSRFFKEQTGENLNGYLNNIRIEKAKELLVNTEMTISEVAKNVGFTNDSSFIRVFKKHTNTTPGSFKKN